MPLILRSVFLFFFFFFFLALAGCVFRVDKNVSWVIASQDPFHVPQESAQIKVIGSCIKVSKDRYLVHNGAVICGVKHPGRALSRRHVAGQHGGEVPAGELVVCVGVIVQVVHSAFAIFTCEDPWCKNQQSFPTATRWNAIPILGFMTFCLKRTEKHHLLPVGLQCFSVGQMWDFSEQALHTSGPLSGPRKPQQHCEDLKENKDV